MIGFRINVSTPDSLENIRFRLFDNDVLVVDDIGTVDFNYLITEPYEGQHTIELTYFQDWNPTVESAPQEILSMDFTLPVLTLEISYEIY